MKTVDDYVDAALKHGGFRSERDLSRHLGLGPSTVNHYRTKRSWPSDETMVALADLARVDERQALLDLNAWRSGSARVRTAYERIRKLVVGTIAAAILGIALLPVGGTQAAQINSFAPEEYLLCDKLLSLLVFGIPDICKPPSRCLRRFWRGRQARRCVLTSTGHQLRSSARTFAHIRTLPPGLWALGWRPMLRSVPGTAP